VSSGIVAQWVEAIRAAFGSGRSSVIELAKVVWTAKRKLHFGQWTAMWRSGDMPFGKRKAEMLAVIGNGLGKLNAHNCAHLPSAWHTLYYLAQLDAQILVKSIQQGTVHPALSTQEARNLLAKFQTARQQSTRTAVRRRLSNFRTLCLRDARQLDSRRSRAGAPSTVRTDSDNFEAHSERTSRNRRHPRKQ
jgi:hypothetical protein